MTRPVPAPPQYRELLEREPALDPVLEEPVEIELTAEHWDVLYEVYWEVMNSARYQRDRPGRDRWGVWRWRRNQGLFRKLWLRHGDCDDFAVEMLRRLVARPDLFPRGCLRLARCIAPAGRRREGHLVLMVTADAGDVVLDSLARGIHGRNAKRFDRYQWIDREQPGERQWVSMARAPTLEDLVRRAG